ncbi:MAG: phosphoribosylformylglycinamidine synthase subunit PurQ [Candidatus Nitrosocaldus sp.]|nr:phosphoribosylformylglycinamidine synthase subunit PurQ [Candidatus Nitrosocaldus sp.]MCS7141069.1 phosphoribosylformylglycinamidine synthase subunit PurQ [Candidatus Nitrosocaldus sp.]MDW8000033.1 phosphoribosylformylglycinamidine synthase subunit PurQ [Candidatus Nitrosocaldus sp.]MDW8275942.1 phosphoribosylformylglycinamidine synthase subunit PurQ [Candidatus Nitrosocaldus sp.]
MPTRIGIVVFPGSNCDRDIYHVLRSVMHVEAEFVWHKRDDLHGYDAIVIPGGFAYADRLRAGVIAAFSPVMQGVKRLARDGVPVLGICNGFQILVESGLLPGAFMRNDSLTFTCRWTRLRLSVNGSRTPFTLLLEKGRVLNIPVANQEGKYYADEDTLREMERNEQIIFRYEDNPNGSIHDIGGVCNEQGNVLGMMPHPERACEVMLAPSPSIHGSASESGYGDGMLIFRSLVSYIEHRWAS